MSERQVYIAIDAIGGEQSPFKILKGSEIFRKTNPHTKLIFFGNKKIIEDSIIKNKIQLLNYEIVNSSEDVTDNDTPSTILRNRKQSSIYKGLEFVKSNPYSGFVSAGNTAALMILSRLLIGMIEGIDRPAICSVIPNRKNFSLMLDLGANVIINGQHKGLIFINDIFEDVRTGDTMKAFVKSVREDNKIDVVLQSPGYKSIEPNANFILDELKAAGGFMPLHDKSDPDAIFRLDWDFAGHLSRLVFAVKEWAGIIAYQVFGRSC